MRPFLVPWRGPTRQLPSGRLAQPAETCQANYGLPQQRAGIAPKMGLPARQPEPAPNWPMRPTHAAPLAPSGIELATAPATRGQAAPAPGAWHIANRQAAARSRMGSRHAELFFDPAATTGRAFRLFTGSNQKLERLVASRADVFEQRHEIGNSTDQPGLQAGATLRSDLGRQTLGAA